MQHITTIVGACGRCYAVAMDTGSVHHADAESSTSAVTHLKAPPPPVIDIVETHLGRSPKRTTAVIADHRARWLAQMAALADPSVCAVDELAVRQSLRAMAEATVRARAADLACFGRFCRSSGSGGLPAPPATIVAYADDLAEAGQKITSITRKLSSIAIAHALLGLDNPCQAIAVRQAVRAIRKERGVARRQALAVRLGQPDDHRPCGITLRRLLEACGDDPPELRDAALLSVAYDAGLRAAELTGVRVEHLEKQQDGSGLLYLPRSKTDQTGEGAYAYLSADAMARVERWLEISAITSGTVFRAIAKRVWTMRKGRPARPDARNLGGGKFVIFERPAEPTVRKHVYTMAIEDEPGQAQLSTQGLVKIYRRCAKRAADRGFVDLAGTELATAIRAFSTHGFRVGLAQDLFAERYDVGQIQLAMRWKSPATALGYARKLQTSANAAAQFLKRHRTKG